MDTNRGYQKAFAANANTSAFTAKVATLTEPVNDGVTKLAFGFGGLVPCRLLVLPYGLGSDNDVFDMRIWAWRRIGSGATPNVLWVPNLLCTFTCTISALVGVAASPVLNTERFADTLALKTDTLVSQPTSRGADGANAYNEGDLLFFSAPGDVSPAWIDLPLRGAEKIEFDFDQTTGTPTMNALIAGL